VLGFHPMELVYAAAPHLFGQTADEAADQIKLAKLIWTLPHSTVSTLVKLVDEMHAISNAGAARTPEQSSAQQPEKV
jgi:hypothetical protein